MEEKVKKQMDIIEKYRAKAKDYSSDLFFDFYTNPKISKVLMIGPLCAPEDAVRPIAETIAHDHGVKVTEYDFSRDWSELPDYRTVFSDYMPDDEHELETVAKRLCDARRALHRTLILAKNIHACKRV